ncbi:MAG: pyridoxine 5'-phosphate synthase [Campylobacterota bacterium]|nr:pyridoxine 5'-phosphate synthase [Campylobacterota bacterium]
MLLGVNIDHIAVLREARQINDPNPLDALSICKQNGADQITIHLREDRRHMQDADTENIIKLSSLPVNLECSINEEMIEIACKNKPHRVTLVPENREEVTTEGGLDIEGNFEKIKKAVEKLHENEIEVSLFIDPDDSSIENSKKLKVDWIELHTGSYANIYAMLYSGLDKTHHRIKELELPRKELEEKLKKSLENIKNSSNYAKKLGLKVAAGHGLNYQNVTAICSVDSIEELNIGQSIVARSVFTGLAEAIVSMKEIVKR